MIEHASESHPCLAFRRIQHGDIDQIIEIEQEAFPEPWSRGMFCQEVTSPMSHFYVALLGDTVVGYVGFWQVVDEAHITSVTVHQDYRGRGFGQQLTRFILGTAARQGLVCATLEVRVSNHRAQNLYMRLGFQKTGVRKGYYKKTNEDAIIMAIKIDSGTQQSEHAEP